MNIKNAVATTVDITRTHTLKQGFEMLPGAASFLRDRYFPTNTATDVFNTEDVLVDYKDGTKTLAPFVLKGGKGNDRVWHTTDRFTPARIAPKRTLTVDDLKKRGFGEALSSGLAPAEREAALALRDLQDLDKQITRREELICAELLMNNAVTMKHYANGDSATADQDITLKFYDGDTNPNQYTPAINWGESGAKIVDDLYAMSQMLIQKGRTASDVILGSDAAAALLGDAEIRELLDIRNFNVGALAPEALPNGVIFLGRLSAWGVALNIFNYCETYVDDAGKTQFYIPANAAIVTAENVGRTLYGCVTQVEQIDKQFHSYEGRRVPKYVSDVDADERTLTLTACPLPAPNYKDGWISATVVAAGE